MKKIYIFAMLIAAFAIVANTHAQTWTRPSPEATTIVAGTGYFIYNVGAKAFLDRGGEWATQAIVFQGSGSRITMIESGTSWVLQYEAANRTLFRASATDGWTYTDNNTAGTNTWDVVLVDAAQNIYTIQSPTTWTSYDATQYLGASATIYNSNSGPVFDVRYNRVASEFTQWKFCTPAAVEKYNAQVRLDKLMNIVKLIGSSIDLTTYIQTYNTGSAADINAAAVALYAALAPVDQTSMIVNPSFELAPATGWTVSANFGYNFQLMEYFGRTYDVFQNISGLAPGIYTLRARGFERPQALTVAAFDWFNNGWDSRSSRLYATVSGTTSFVPLRSIFSETTSPAGNLISGFTFPNSMSNANDAFQLGLYESELTYFVVDASGTARIGMSGSFRSNGAFTMGQWALLDNFRLHYFGALAIPNMTVTKSTIFLSNLNAVSTTFDVAGSNMTGNINISAPIPGITLSGANLINNGGGSYTIAMANVNATNSITLTWDEAANLSGTITISGAGVSDHTITVSTSKDKGCFTPLYPSRTNLVPDPGLNSLSHFGGWGARNLISAATEPANVFCGASSISVGSGTGINSGSLDVVLTGNLAPNRDYHVRAMVKTVDGTFQLGVYGWSAGQGDINNVIDTQGAWMPVDFIFKTGETLGTAQGMFWNNWGLTGTISYIDNWEMYEIITVGNIETQHSRLSAGTIGNMVSIFGTQQGELIRIFSTNGQLIQSLNATSNRVDVKLQSGIYIIRSNDQVLKVLLK